MCWCFINYWFEKCTVKHWNLLFCVNLVSVNATPLNSKLLHYCECVHDVWYPRSLQWNWRRLRSCDVWRRVCGPTYDKPHDVTAIPSKLFGDGLTIFKLRWLYIVHKDSVSTSQRTQCTSSGETKLMNTV